MKIIITGGNGYLGRKIYSRFYEEGFQVGIIVRSHSSMNYKNEVIHEYKDHTRLKEFIIYFKPELCVHLASVQHDSETESNIDEIISSNIKFGVELLDSLNHANCKKFLNVGTSWQHLNSNDYNPVNLYAASKQAFQDILTYYIFSKGFKAITLKLFDVYGPDDDRKKVINILLDHVGKDYYIDLTSGYQLIDFVYLDDVVNAFIIAAKRLISIDNPVHEVYGVGTGAYVNIRELVELINLQTDKTLKVNFGGKKHREREVFQPWKGFNFLPGWSPTVAIEEGLKNIIHQRTLENSEE
jgi:CDP-3, 6-dideoxy-D-glycero-L-glycero-4-hexulose-4-reductase